MVPEKSNRSASLRLYDAWTSCVSVIHLWRLQLIEPVNGQIRGVTC